MRKLTLDETWDYTKRMWKWIAFQKEVLEDTRHVGELKKIWLAENAPEFVGMLWEDCFFCTEKRDRYGMGNCEEQCAASLVEEGFGCCRTAYSWSGNPGAFYREILRLDAIRTAAPPEHEWVHGDVFKRKFGTGTLMVYLVTHEMGPVVYLLDYSGPGQGMLDACLADATFLFNIRDIIKDKL